VQWTHNERFSYFIFKISSSPQNKFLDKILQDFVNIVNNPKAEAATSASCNYLKNPHLFTSEGCLFHLQHKQSQFHSDMRFILHIHLLIHLIFDVSFLHLVPHPIWSSVRRDGLQAKTQN